MVSLVEVNENWGVWECLAEWGPLWFNLYPLPSPQATESEMGDVDLSGLPEAPVDSEEEEEEDEDLERASDPLLGRDMVRECLEKEPADRNDDDIGELSSSSPLRPVSPPSGSGLNPNLYSSTSVVRQDESVARRFCPYTLA